MLRGVRLTAAAAFTLILVLSCGSGREFSKIEQKNLNAKLVLEQIHAKEHERKVEVERYDPEAGQESSGSRIVMNAVVENGEYITVDTLRRVHITANYKHIPERGGIVDIPFTIVVPPSLLDKKWQLRLTPKLFWGRDSLSLEGLVITGQEYKEEQLRGLQKYKKFVESIVTNPDDYLQAFGYLRLLEKFCKRNVDKKLFSASRQEAEEHYINNWLLNSNNKKIKQLAQKYKEWCQVYQTSSDLRLDTIITGKGGELVYRYLQRVGYKRNMNRIKVAFEGVLCSVTKQQYELPKSDTLFYNITSIAQFTSFDPLYIDRVIERRVTKESSAYLNFEVGKYEVIDTLKENKDEIGKVKTLFERIAEEKEFEIDSVIITANCSPEGYYGANSFLAKKRSESVKEYFKDNLGRGIKLISRYQSEDWATLQNEILKDSLIKDKAYLIECYKVEDLDKREQIISLSPDYNYLKERIYPLLRRIDIVFALHRKGMIKDTIHTQEPDNNYTRAIEALQERDYNTAAALMKGYRCTNNVIALIGLERNREALDILNAMPENSLVNYLKAIAYTRLGDDALAIVKLDEAVREDDTLAFRVNLDPEINSLAAKYSRDYINASIY